MTAIPERLNLARIPTPLEPLPQLSREWGVDLRIKRDDLTGAELSGNKVRKLEYLLADALRKQCDMIISCGAVNSNHARAAAIAARKLGLDCCLILGGEKPPAAHGNLQLDLLVGAEVNYIPFQDYFTQIDSLLQQMAEQLIREGKKPYIIPTGGSNPVGLLGYVEAVREIREQCEVIAWKPDIIVCAVGSGGTYSGLFLGNEITPLATTILGVLVCSTVDHFTQKIARDVSDAVTRFDLHVPVPQEKIRLLDGYISGGYAQTDSEQLRLIRHVGQTEAIILEPVYTGKTMYGIHQEIQAGRIPKGAKILFIHTGGIFGLSAFTERMTQEWKGVTKWPDDYLT